MAVLVDDSTLQQAILGDDAALDAVLSQVQPTLYRYSMRMCRHPEDAEDVLQDSLISIARSLRDFRGASALSTWVYTIARSACIKKRRKSVFAPPTETPLHEVTVSSTAPDPESEVGTAELWEQVQGAIRALPAPYREVLVLRDVEGLSTQEVAKVVGASLAAVKSRLHRARSLLREALAGAPQTARSDCPDIRLTFSRYLEGDLTAKVCSRMQKHIDACPSCAAECDGLQAVLGACASAPAEVPLAVQRRVQAAIRDALTGDQAGSPIG